MRSEPNARLSDSRRLAGLPQSNSGHFLFRLRGHDLEVIASDGGGWDHVSVSARGRCPSWEEMCFIKDKFFRDDEAVMQLHPPKAEYINNHPYVLHLWRPQTEEGRQRVLAERRAAGEDPGPDFGPAPGPIPLPPRIMVGLDSLNMERTV